MPLKRETPGTPPKGSIRKASDGEIETGQCKRFKKPCSGQGGGVWGREPIKKGLYGIVETPRGVRAIRDKTPPIKRA